MAMYGEMVSIKATSEEKAAWQAEADRSNLALLSWIRIILDSVSGCSGLAAQIEQARRTGQRLRKGG